MNKTIIELREEAIKEDKNPEFYLYQKLEEKDKEIESLKNQLDFIEEQNHIIDKLEKENERLNNVINELEKWLEESKKYGSLVYSEIKEDGSFEEFIKLEEIKNKLKELKEGN